MAFFGVLRFFRLLSAIGVHQPGILLMKSVGGSSNVLKGPVSIVLRRLPGTHTIKAVQIGVFVHFTHSHTNKGVTHIVAFRLSNNYGTIVYLIRCGGLGKGRSHPFRLPGIPVVLIKIEKGSSVSTTRP